jgi:hypothetical protein
MTFPLLDCVLKPLRIYTDPPESEVDVPPYNRIAAPCPLEPEPTLTQTLPALPDEALPLPIQTDPDAPAVVEPELITILPLTPLPLAFEVRIARLPLLLELPKPLMIAM